MTESSTATTAGAKAHARAQEAQALAEGVAIRSFVPASSPLVWSEVVAGGGYAHRRLAAGTTVRLTDLDGDACAHVLLYNADEPWERLNVADTVKVQWQAYLHAGQLLLSDQARVLAAITADTSGRHDTLYGTSAAARNVERYGDGAPHGPSPAGRELFVLAAAKHGLGRRDIPPSVSFFQGVRIDEGGHPVWEGSAGPGAAVELTTQMDAILLIANVPHPLDPRPVYTSSPLRVEAWKTSRILPDSPLWTETPEGRRAFDNTLDYLRGRGLA